MGDSRDRQARDIAGKLRLTAAALGCAGQKELCAAFRRVNPDTAFGLDRSYKWMQGRSLPRSAHLYGDWAAVLGLDRPGAWIASCALEEFADALCAQRGLDREMLLRRADLGGVPAGEAAGESYLCGAYACYSHAQSPYYGGRVVRGALTIEPGFRGANTLVATYSQALAVGRAHASGPVLLADRAISLTLSTCSQGAAPLFLNLFRPAPPASVLAGIMGGFTMVDPDGQPPYATRIAMVRVPIAVAKLEASNRYMDPVDNALSSDLAALGLWISDADGLEARLWRLLSPGQGQPGSDRVPTADYIALAADRDRAWLAGLAPAAHPPAPGETGPLPRRIAASVPRR